MSDNLNNLPITPKLATRMIRQVRPRDGDVLLVKQGTKLSQTQNVDALTHALIHMGHKTTIIIVVEDFDTLQKLDEKTMNKHGWFRANHLGKLVKQDDTES